MLDSDNFRQKVEQRELCDLGTSIQEKYGPYSGWKLQLRDYTTDLETQVKKGEQISEENDKVTEKIVEYKCEVGGRFAGINSVFKDKRTKKIDVVRKIPMVLRSNELTPMQKQNLQ